MDSLTKLNLDNYKPLRDVVFENLRSAILEGKLKSGQRLMEVQLAEQLGVSRTPVREAIRKLEVEDLQLIVAIDCYGNNIYEKGRRMFAK